MSTPGEPRDGGHYSPPESYQQYQPPAGYEQHPAQSRNGFGIAALVLGLFALLLSWTIFGGIILGLLALVFGLLGRARAKRGEATNGGLSVAGVVLGILGLLIAIAFAVFIFNSPAVRDFQQCVEQSGDDQVKIQQCASEFGRQLEGG